VIVVDPSRWSRDNVRNETGLDTLRDNGVRFFVGTMEYDLHNPDQRMVLAFFSVINKRQAETQAMKSMLSKIDRCKQGIPSIGRLPFARTFDWEGLRKLGRKPEDCWGLDEEKAALFRQCAHRYINGENPIDLAPLLGLYVESFTRILKYKSGSTLTVRFHKPKLKIDETVEMPIPALLTPEEIEQVWERIRINTTYTRGNRKYRYLLGGYVFCDRCGYTMRGQYRSSRYYIHRVKSRVKDGCTWSKNVKAEDLEAAVLISLVRTVGDPVRMKEAVARNTPDSRKRAQLEAQKAQYTKTQAEVQASVQRLIKQAEIGVYDGREEELRIRIEELNNREAQIRDNIAIVDRQLSNLPDPVAIRELSKLGKAVMKHAAHQPHILLKKSYEWKRQLVEHSFSGPDEAGNRLGVYLDYDEDGRIRFTVRGRFGTDDWTDFPSDDDLAEGLDLDSFYHDIKKELKNFKGKLNVLSKSQGRRRKMLSDEETG